MLSKFEAGADYLLSQPFYDMRLLEIYSEFVPQQNIYWGISPVTSEKSKNYWEKVNNAVFPQSYLPTYEWNIQFAGRVLKHCATHKSNVYFMPISIDLEKYFLPIAKIADQVKNGID
jgi:methylenetetrahydrofolate reductase (NADPH)